ncbi:MAG: hypothetical protein AB7F59_11110 [Bdellovibrionales bacterium]
MKLSKQSLSHLLVMLAVLSACGTIRLNYEGEVRSGEEKPATYNLKKSYEVGGPHKMLCILTGWALGGYCWYYTVMPTTEQSKWIERDAEARLDTIYGSGKYTLVRKNIEVDSWGDSEEQSNLLRSEDAPTPLVNGKPVETKSAKKKVEAQKTEQKQ